MMLLDTMCTRQPAAGLWEAVLMPAQAANETDFVPVQASADQMGKNRGSAAGRAVLSARGIQLPSPVPMRRMAAASRQSVQPAPCAEEYPITAVLEKAEWR